MLQLGSKGDSSGGAQVIQGVGLSLSATAPIAAASVVTPPDPDGRRLVLGAAIGFRVEPRDPDPTKPGHPYSGVGHVHVEIRCPE